MPATIALASSGSGSSGSIIGAITDTPGFTIKMVGFLLQHGSAVHFMFIAGSIALPAATFGATLLDDLVNGPI
jgi:hypothetical protein